MVSGRKLFVTILLFLLCSYPATARDKLVVVYPEVPAPANLLFEEIVSGIESAYPDNLVIRAIGRTESPDASLEWVNAQHPEMLIALGKRGYRIAKYIYKNRPVAIGALPIRPNGISGISLLADPGVMFDLLKELAPHISVVNVVYSPSSRWLMSLAAEQASEKGLTFNQIEVKSLKDAISTYDDMLSKIDPNTEAVWLPVDKITAHEQVILPNLLEKSWEQNVVLFSSKPAHAKRGALFSVVPDNEALGRQLVKMVRAIHQSKDAARVIPLQDMRLAVNLRTAAHLGFDYKSQQKEQFHLTFPQ